MKKHLIIIIISLLIAPSVYATDITKKPFTHYISLVLGTDAGAAVPFPIRYLLNGDKFSGAPQLKITGGLGYLFPIDKHWSFGANILYKNVCLNAQTRVTDQRFQDYVTGAIQYFSGTAEAIMEFPMWEVPAFAKYSFNRSHSVLAGIYGAWVTKPSFESIAKKGYVGTEPNSFAASVDKDLVMSFTPALRNWECGLLAGYEYQLTNKFAIGARIYMGLTDIFVPSKRGLAYKMIPLRGSFLLSYNIFKVR